MRFVNSGSELFTNGQMLRFDYSNASQNPVDCTWNVSNYTSKRAEKSNR